MNDYLTREEAATYFDDVKQLFQDTDRKMQDTDRYLRQRAMETERQLKHNSDATRVALQELSRKMGKLGNRLGEFVQEMVRPAVVRLFQARGLEVHIVSPNISVVRDEGAMEIDLLVTNDDVALAVECKSNLSVEDVDEHLQRMDKFKVLFHKFSDMQVMGAVAGMVVPDEVARYAYRKGLFVLAQSGDSIVIRNDEKFRPSVW